MTITPLSFSQVGLKIFPASGDFAFLNKKVNCFDLSSHARAKESIEFALKMRHGGFHVFVVGDDRSGRMSATLTYLQHHVKQLDPPRDWIYVNHFAKAYQPLPFSLPAGMAKTFQKAMKEVMSNVTLCFQKHFSNPHYMSEVDRMSLEMQNHIQEELTSIQHMAAELGFQVKETDEGFVMGHLNNENPLTLEELLHENVACIRKKITQLTFSAQMAEKNLEKDLMQIKKTVATQILTPLFNAINMEFGCFLGVWLKDVSTDILENIDAFLEKTYEASGTTLESFLNRYAVNVFVDNEHVECPKVILEDNPTYETLFGSIKYVNSPSGYETNFTMIRSGVLHLCNGGILVLRADALAKDPVLWDSLKGALRDRCIRLHEHYRDNSMPLIDAPEPQSIPLSKQFRNVLL